jgi:AmpE protein
MTFITILIALIIERFFHWSQLRHWQWFSRYQYMMNIKIGNQSRYLLLAACVLPPVFIVAIITRLLSGWFYHIPEIIFGLVILIYCIGPSNLWVQIYSCLNALNKEDPHAALEQIKTAFGIDYIDQPQALHKALTRTIFVAANQRIFAVIFWFAVLGPWGAVLYRLLNLCATNGIFGMSETAMQGQAILDWLPARLFAFIFALVGDFMAVFNCWKKSAKEGVNANNKILGDCGLAALGCGETEYFPEGGSAEKEALALLDRVFIMILDG